MILNILTMQTANGCTAPMVWRPWARPQRLLLLQRRRKQRRLAKRRATKAADFYARDPQTVVWVHRAFFSSSQTRLKRTHNHILWRLIKLYDNKCNRHNDGYDNGGHVNHRARTSRQRPSFTTQYNCSTTIDDDYLLPLLQLHALPHYKIPSCTFLIINRCKRTVRENKYRGEQLMSGRKKGSIKVGGLVYIIIHIKLVIYYALYS